MVIRMKVNEAMARIDALRPNTVDEKTKRGWLTRVDQYVFSEIVSRREGAEGKTFTPYGDGEGERETLVPPPYDELYIFYLEGMIYYTTRELDKMSGSMVLYNQTMREYKNRYFSRHGQLPLPPTKYR